MKKIILLGAFTTLISCSLFSQNINGRFSSSVYMFEAVNGDSLQTSNAYARAFQMLNLNVNHGNFLLRTSLNLESDLSQDVVGDPRLRFYDLYLEGRNLLNLFTLKIGRQPLITNVAGGMFDGANLDVKYSDFKLTGYYGGNVPAYQKLEFTNDLSNDYVLGGKFAANAFENLRLSLGYIKKNFKPQSYNTVRLDADLNPITVLIQSNSNQYEYVSAEANYEAENLFDADAQFEYDLNLDKPSKYELNASYNQINNLVVDFYYNYREPRIRYNSIFSVFDFGNTQEIEAGGSYKINKLFTVSGRYGNVNYHDGENSGRVTAGLSSDYGSITYRKTFGFAGELDALSLYSAYTFLEGFLTPSAGLSFTNYKLSEDSEKNNLTTILAGLNIRPWKMLSFDVQGQYMDNKIYKNDYRFFFKVNYWFNTNLN